MFLLEQSETLYGHSHANNSSIIMLYRIAKDTINQDVEKEEELSDIVDVICSNNEKLLKKVENSLENVPGAGKSKQIVSRALEFNLLAKRKYITSNTSESSLESLPKFRLKKEQQGYGKSNDDLDFIVKYRKKNVGKMNWKKCFELANQENLCKGFSNGESMRSFLPLK